MRVIDGIFMTNLIEIEWNMEGHSCHANHQEHGPWSLRHSVETTHSRESSLRQPFCFLFWLDIRRTINEPNYPVRNHQPQ